jgi:hypothetical protein
MLGGAREGSVFHQNNLILFTISLNSNHIIHQHVVGPRASSLKLDLKIFIRRKFGLRKRLTLCIQHVNTYLEYDYLKNHIIPKLENTNLRVSSLTGDLSVCKQGWYYR